MPRRCNSPAPPTPESWRIWTEPIEPAARITSPRARADRLPPLCRPRPPAPRRPPRAAFFPPAPPRRARPVDRDLFHQTVGFEPQIGALEHGFEKPARRRPAPPALLVDVEDATAL